MVNRKLEKLISELQTGNARKRRAASYKLGGSLGFGGVVADKSRIWQKRDGRDARTRTEPTAQPAKSGSGQV